MIKENRKELIENICSEVILEITRLFEENKIIGDEALVILHTVTSSFFLSQGGQEFLHIFIEALIDFEEKLSTGKINA